MAGPSDDPARGSHSLIGDGPACPTYPPRSPARPAEGGERGRRVGPPAHGIRREAALHQLAQPRRHRAHFLEGLLLGGGRLPRQHLVCEHPHGEHVVARAPRAPTVPLAPPVPPPPRASSEEHTSELQSRLHLVCPLLL